MARLSGIQQDVLSLYRRILRETARKDRREHSGGTDISQSFHFLSLLGKNKNANAAASLISNHSTAYASAEFRRQADTAKRSDFKKIEYMIRRGDKQIKLLRMPGVKVVSGTPHS